MSEPNSDEVMEDVEDTEGTTENDATFHLLPNDMPYANDQVKQGMIMDNDQIPDKADFISIGVTGTESIHSNLRCKDCMLDKPVTVVLDPIDHSELLSVGKDVQHALYDEASPKTTEERSNEGRLGSMKSNVGDFNASVSSKRMKLDPSATVNFDLEHVDLAEKGSDVELQANDEFVFNLDMDWETVEESEIENSQQIGNIRQFDLKLLRECVEAGESVLSMVDDKDVILIVGKTGVGKSLFIQGIAGKKIVSHVYVSPCYGKNISTHVFEALDPLPGFAIGHDKVSKTKSINCFCQSDSEQSSGNIVYIDSPGWEDTDGAEVDIATSIMLTQVVKRARTLRIVLLISYASLLEDRGGAIRGVLKLAHTFASDFEKDMKSFVFLFTHSNEVDIPSSLDEARSCLTDEILRILKDTKDNDVKKILLFMHQSLVKRYGFVDILHPVTADFTCISNFIENQVSSIRQPAPIANCGMTPKSEMKLIGQAKHMLNLVHQLLQSIQVHYNRDSIHELKKIKETFGYLSKYVGIGEIDKASRECEQLVQNHINRQRLSVEEQLDRIKDENTHFDEGHIQNLKDAMSQLDTFATNDDGGISLQQYTEKLLQDVFESCFSRCQSTFHDFDRTIKDFHKIRILKEGFPCCEKQYRVVFDWLKAQIDGICVIVSRPNVNDFECFDVQSFSEHGLNLVRLGAIMRENTIISDYGIATSTIVSTFESAKQQVSSVSVMWASSIPVFDNGDVHLLPQILQNLLVRVEKLETLLTILYPSKEQFLFTNLVDSINEALDCIEAMVQTHFQSICTKLQDNPANKGKQMAAIAFIESDFGKLQSPRWQCTKRIYQDMHSNLQNVLMMKALKLENAARTCTDNGLGNGKDDGNLYKDFKSYLWFDLYSSNTNFVRTKSDSAYENYCSRMKLVKEQITECGAKLKVLSEKNAEQLELYCKCVAEFKQFNRFEATAKITLLHDETGKGPDLMSLYVYVKELRQQTKQFCCQWSARTKEANDTAELTFLTQKLNMILEETEAIEKIGNCIKLLKGVAVTTKKKILKILQIFNVRVQEEFETTFKYEDKAALLRCVSIIHGFPQTDCYLPQYIQLAEKSRNLVSNHAVSLQKVMTESVDTQKIRDELNAFRKAKFLDPYTNDEAAKRLPYLESLCEKQTEVCDQAIGDMIDRKDFVEIGKYLRPLRSSPNVVKRNKLNMYSRKIADILNQQIQSCEGKLHSNFSKRDAQYIVDTLGTLKAADNEIGMIIYTSTKLQLCIEVRNLITMLDGNFKVLLSKFLKGFENNDFYAMGINHHLATIIYEVAGSYLSWEANRSYNSGNTKWKSAQKLVSDKIKFFLKSIFQEFHSLLKALSTLKQASIDDNQLPGLRELYNKCVLDLSKEVADRLLAIREHVEGTCCYNDGIPVLKAFENAYEMGMAAHLNPPPFDCSRILEKWIQEQSKLNERSALPGISSLYLKDMKTRMDNLQKPSFVQWFQQFFQKSEILSYKDLQDQLEQRVLRESHDGTSNLQKQDIMLLKRSLDRLTQISETLDMHVPLASVLKRDLEEKVFKVFVDTCLKSVHYLEIEDVVHFEAIFPKLRHLAIGFPFILDHEDEMREFSLVAQLVHGILQRSIDKLLAAIDSHDFLAVRNQLGFNRNHGAFLADHYGLLFEELKQFGKLKENEWFNRIWEICREHFATGRDLLKIKSFAILGVVASASEADIKRAYKQKALQEHPDKKVSIDGDSGEEFRRVKDAQDELLNSDRFINASQLFDSLIRGIPTQMEKHIKEWLSTQDYRRVSNLLEQLSEFKRICDVVDPPLEFDEVVDGVNEIIKGHVHGIQLDVERFWNERNYRELNLCIEDLRLSESHLKSFPHAFPKSWNQGIIKKVEKDIEEKGNEAQLLLNSKETARNSFDQFKRCIIEMGAIFLEIQMFSKFTKCIMYGVLESCLRNDWGYPYLFELGLSLQKGDDTLDDVHNDIGQSVVAEFSHFKEVLTMVWNEETSQKPPEDTLQGIKILRPKKNKVASLLLKSERDALLHSYHSFDAAYMLLLSEYLPSISDIGKLATHIIELAKTLKPLRCSSGWTVQVKEAIPQLLAGIFAMFTIVKSGESYNRIIENSRDENRGHNLLMKPHNIQVLTLLQLFGCDNPSKESLKNQLMQIRTGEGKSMILGAAAALLGLLGFRVRCVCYSEYLSTRDSSLFQPIFNRLNLEDRVTYSIITTLSEDSTSRLGDIRALTESMLLKDLGNPSNCCPQNSRVSACPLGLVKQNDHIRSFPAFRNDKINEVDQIGATQSDPTEATSITETLPRSLNCFKSGLSSVCTRTHITTSTLPSSIFPSDADTEEILLVDEVDVFFGSDFYGRTYNQVTELRRPEIAAIIIAIWNNFKKGGRRQRLGDVQASSHYRSLIKTMPSFQFLIDQEIRIMLDHVRRVEPYIFDPSNDRIGYKVIDTISYKVTFGYQTVFAYLKEADDGNLRDKKATLNRVLFMPVSCGQFSYANINPSRILGVSGTLEVMGKDEKDILLEYGIRKYVLVPSVYGKSNFVFDKAGEGVYIEREKNEYFQKICDEIHNKTKRGRAVIVFFKDSIGLKEFMNSPFSQKLGRQKNVLSEDMDPQAKDFAINKAATSGQVTLCPAVFGRGTDFFCTCEKTQDAGGVHIIQTFLSTETSEEVQIQGRTARQGKKGSYQMILLECDLECSFGLSKGEQDKIPRDGRYEWLDNARKLKYAEHWEAVMENLKLATKRDKATHSYFSSLLRGDQSEAETLFKDLYAMIKKPPVPDEIAIDIAFLLDITGSMTPYCQHAISTIGSLVTGNGSILTMLKPLFPGTTVKVRFSFLAYKDIDDKGSQFNECVYHGGESHFTKSTSKMLASIESKALCPSGGKDICEDHLGAIDRCINWNLTSDWTSPIKFIVLFTDAPAHGLAPACSVGMSNVDNYAVCHPHGLTSSSVASSMIAKEINMMICSYNPVATAHMEKIIAEEYLSHPDNSKGREIKSISMIPQSAVIAAATGKPLLGDQPRHIIFVLDESGSMEHDWPGVVTAFRGYITRRRQNQNEEDLVSVVQFDDKARVTILLCPIGTVPSDLDYRGGGTQFAPASMEGRKVTLQTPMSHRPTLVFMSDGVADDAPSAAAILNALNDRVCQKYGNNMELHVIAFGNGADTQQLSQISRSSPIGRIHLTSDTIQLTNIFVQMAGGQQVATALQGEIAKEISEAVSDTLSLEYLS